MGFFCYTEEEVERWLSGKTEDGGFFDHMVDCSLCGEIVDKFYNRIIKTDYLSPDFINDKEKEA